MHEKRHWNKKCKQKQSLLFNSCNFFDLLTSKTEKIVWWAPVFKSEEDFIVSYLLKCRLKTLLTNTLLSTSWVHLIFALAKYQEKNYYMVAIVFIITGFVLFWSSATLDSSLFCFSSGLLLQIINDGAANNFQKYETALILPNITSVFFEPQVSYLKPESIILEKIFWPNSQN